MRHGLSFVCAFLLAAAGLPSIAFLQTSPMPTPSEPPRQEAVEMILGKPIERELKSGEKHAYTLDLKAGEFAHVEVEQKGIDVKVIVFGPDGKQLVNVYIADGSRSGEPVYLVSETGGTYRLEVQVMQEGSQPGRYQAKWSERKPAESKTRDLATALTLFCEGRQSRDLGTKNALEEAVKKFEAALALWRVAGDKGNEARTLNDFGSTLQSLGQVKQALEYHQKALPLFRIVANQTGEVQTLVYTGWAYSAIGENQKALDNYTQALPIFQALEDRQGEAVTLTSIGSAYGNLGDYRKALEFQEKAVRIFQDIGDRMTEATTLNSIGLLYSTLGDYQKALGIYERALLLRRATGNRRGEGATLSNIGIVHAALGDYRKAIDLYSQALVLSRATGARSGEAYILNNIGSAHRGLGELTKALEFYDQALPLHRSTGNRSGEAQTLNNIATVYFNLREFQQALDFHLQAQSLQQAIGDKQGTAYTLTNLGAIQEHLGTAQKALESYSQAILLFVEISDRIGQSKAVFNSAKLERNQQNLASARTKIEEAVKLVETTRSSVAAQNLRASYFATIRGYYDLYIDILMKMHKADPKAGHDLEAFRVSERARARGLLDLLAESRADIRQGVDPKLLAEEVSTQDRLRIKQEALTRLLVGKHTPDQADEAKKEIDALTDEYRQIQTKIRQTSPRYAALTQPEPLTVKQLQQTVLDSDTVLLEYALGDDQSYVWAVTTDSVTAVELPKRADIEAAAREFYELLKAPPPASPELVRTADKLSRMILAPVADKLGDKRLVVVADGALQYVPFAALPEPQADPKRKTEPLVVRHEIVSLPSASALAVLRNETKDRKPAEKILAVLADPVFSPKDKRLTEQAASVAAKQPETEDFGRSRVLTRMAELADASSADRAAGETKLTLPRLLNSRREADQISRFVEPDRLLKALDFEAGREAATGGELSKYRYLHFATHGLLDTQRPELSSIVLSLVDKDGNLKDGFLRAFDIYNLNLPAELAVLSACKTGLGKEIRGEGLVGLTRGFMYAGTKRVVVSLWSVDDTATGELMARFYKKMLKDGMRPAAALRSAQVEMWGDKQWTAPFFWAAFALQGEWK